MTPVELFLIISIINSDKNNFELAALPSFHSPSFFCLPFNIASIITQSSPIFFTTHSLKLASHPDLLDFEM